MKNFFLKSVLVFSAACNFATAKKQDFSKPVTEAVYATDLEQESKELGEYVLLMMSIVKADMSDAKKVSIARNIVIVANDVFETLEQRKQFVVMIAIESRFNPDAQSSAGALGLTQVMPEFAKEFGKPCGILDFSKKDLTDPSINLLLGACRFNALLTIFKGQPVPALVAYNAGLASNQLKQLQSLGSISNTETASYVVKWAYIKDHADQQREKPSKEDKDVKNNKLKQGT